MCFNTRECRCDTWYDTASYNPKICEQWYRAGEIRHSVVIHLGQEVPPYPTNKAQGIIGTMGTCWYYHNMKAMLGDVKNFLALYHFPGFVTY